jgi:membrane protein implicated in regulation of membrane protease activity
MAIHDWHLWAATGLFLIIFEMATGTFFAASFGVAALITALPAAADASRTTQLVVFALLSVVCISLVRPLFRGWIYKKSDATPMLAPAMVGQLGTVVDEIEPNHGHGRVKIGGEEWRAQAADNAGFKVGTRVRITAVDGATVTVSAVL